MSDTETWVTQWKLVSHLLDEALLLPIPEQRRWLADLPAEHAPLRETLRHFLELHARIDGEGFLEGPAAIAADTTPAAMLSPGDIVGPYRVIEELGTGGMGSVWLAERSDGKPRRRLALKLPRMMWASDLSERMERERDILGSLEHPNIARLYDAGLDDQGRPYLAIEYVEGIRITHYCQENELDTRRRVQLFMQVLAAVQYAHTRLVLHRDLKPGNILVNRNGDVRLLDFGIAKLIEETLPDDEPDLITMTRALTPRYASPEQLRGERLTLVSDVYSLGVILYELLTGVSPYPKSAKSRGELELAVIEGVIVPPSRRAASESGTSDLQLAGFRLSRELRGDLDAIVMKSLSLAVQGRYASVEALTADLERWLNGRPVHAIPPSALLIARKFILRNRVAVSVAAVAVVGVLTASGIAIYQADKATAESQRAAATRDFLIDMFESANPELHGGREATVRELLHAATQRLTFEGNNDAILSTEMYAAIAKIWLKFGDDANAIEALQKRVDVFSGNDFLSGEVAARIDEARLAAHGLRIDRLRYVLESADLREGAADELISTQADRNWLLGWLLLDEGRIQDARKYFLDSNGMSHEIRDELRIIRSYYGFASVSARSAEATEVRQIVRNGLSQVEKSTLSQWQKIQRRFELITCLAVIGDYEFGWPLMSELFVDAGVAFSDWVPSQVEIYSYFIIWALRVGESKRARDAISVIRFEDIPDSLRKADLMLAVSLFNIRSGSTDTSTVLIESALDIYKKLDAQRSYKASAVMAEVAVVEKNQSRLHRALTDSTWVSSPNSRYSLDQALLLEWFSGVDKYFRQEFSSAEVHFLKALNFARKLGPDSHPRVHVIQLAIWKSALISRRDMEVSDKEQFLSLLKRMKGASVTSESAMQVLHLVEQWLQADDVQVDSASYPEWKLSLL